jgi:hypothetical protein
MGNITLNKTSGGQMTIAPEDGTSNETVTIPSVGVMAADVPTGKILQQQAYISSAANDVSVATGDYSGSIILDSFTMTVKEGSQILLWFNTSQYVASITTTNLQIYLEVDGTALAGNNANATDYNHIWYQTSGRMAQTNWFLTNPLSEGTHTLNFRVARYNSGTITLNYQSRKFRYLLQEVAQ